MKPPTDPTTVQNIFRSWLPHFWVRPTPEKELELRHHLRIFKMRPENGYDYSSHPWRIECACGEWQQANHAVDIWKYIPYFRHIKRGWGDELVNGRQ